MKEEFIAKTAVSIGIATFIAFITIIVVGGI